MASADKTAQDEEIESLQSIYLPDEFSATVRSDGVWEILAPVSIPLPDNFQVHYATHGNATKSLDVQHLPPITLKITLRRSYPSKSPPYLTISCVWLTPLERRMLYNHLTHLWWDCTGFPIIYNWIECVRGEALEITGKTDGINLVESLVEEPPVDDTIPSGSQASGTHFSRTTKKPHVPLQLIPFLEAFNIQKKRDVFLKSPVTCEICFTEKMGKDAVQFNPCRHLYCRDCLSGYFTLLVTEGSSAAVKCPGYKCDSEATQSQVREVLPADLFDKYDKALLSTMLDTMSDIVYCPRTTCNYPVSWEPEDKVAICPNCRYAFCIYCRMVYHGVEPCKLNADERRKLVESYQTATPEDRSKMETRYGKKQIENLVNNTLSEYWIKDNGKKCPKCNIVIEKSDGCNKMTCFRCQAFFCWLCGKMLDVKSPYLHFQDPRSGCNNKLFQFPEGAEEDWEGEWEMDEWVGDDSDAEDLQGNDTDTESEII